MLDLILIQAFRARTNVTNVCKGYVYAENRKAAVTVLAKLHLIQGSACSDSKVHPQSIEAVH